MFDPIIYNLIELYIFHEKSTVLFISQTTRFDYSFEKLFILTVEKDWEA